MANPIIKIKRSAVAGKIPTTNDVQLGEFAINTFDGKVYIEKDQSSVGIGTTIIVINPWNVGLGSTSYDITFNEGDVGIGTTNPLQILDIRGNAIFSQSVGIGTTIPGYSLDVIGDINFTGNLNQNGSQFVSSRWSVGSGTTIYRESFVGIGSTLPSYSLDVSGDINYSGSLRQNGAEVVPWNTGSGSDVYRLDGDVGIGTTNPVYRLEVIGDVNYTGNLYQNGSEVVPWNTGSESDIYRLNGDVGIGTTNPTFALDVVGSIRASDHVYGNGSNLTGVVTTLTAGSHINIISIGGSSTVSFTGPLAPITFLLDEAYGFSTTTRNVGIGTTSSTIHALSVVGLTTLDGNVYINGNLNSNGVSIFTGGMGNSADYTVQSFYGTYYGVVSPAFANHIATSIIGSGSGTIQYNNGDLFAGDPLLVWNQNTNSLGIGTTVPQYTTHIVGDLNFTGDLYEDGVLRQKTNWVNTSTNVYVSGSVGIGTTIPQVELDVIGDANISGALNVGGDVSIIGGIDVAGIITASNLKNFEFKGDIITSAVLDEGIDFIADVTFTSKYWSANLVGSAITESAYYCDMDSSENVYVVGTTETNAVLAKYNQYGDVQWQTALSGSGNQKGTSVGVGTTSVYICGKTEGNDGFIARYDLSGSLVWRKAFGYSGIGSTTITSIDVAESLVVDNSDNAYVVGYGGTVAEFEVDISQYSPNSEILILKYNSDGSIVWKRSIGGVGIDYGFDISKDSSDNLYICGSTTHESTFTFKTFGLYNGFIAKYNSSGTLQWQRGLGSRGIEHANGIDTDSSGNVYVVGYNIPQESTKSKLFLAKYNSSGTLQWQKFLTDDSLSIRGYSVKVGSDDTIYVAGTKSTTTAGKYELIWAKYTDTGAVLLQRTVYGKDFTDNVKINLDELDNVYLTSSADDNLFVIKLTPDGSKRGTYVGIEYGSLSLTESTAGLSTFITTFTEYNATFISDTALNSVGILSITNYGTGFTTTSNPVLLGITTAFEHSTSFTGLSTGSNLTINILSVDINGGITSFSISDPGRDYLVNDIVSPLSNTTASFKVLSIIPGTELSNGITTFTSEKTSISKSSFAGNLGVGVSNPNSKLHVIGETKLDGPLNVGGSVGSETIPQTVISTYENVEWRDLYFEQFELDDLGTAVTGIENTFVPTFNQERVTIYTPYQLNISVDGIPQPSFLYNTEYVWTSDVLTSRSGYTIDYDGNIKFSESIPMESTIVARVISGRQSQTKLKKYPFSALDIVMH